MAPRCFEAASVVSVGTQNHDGRFGSGRRHPPVAHWRCNLTALSQTRNLYFVAYTSHIHVYVPRYPTQELPHTPALILPSQPSSAGLRGTVSPRHPHAINHLVVQDLGNEEVVAAVRDDGDVNAWLVRRLVHAIERRAQDGSGIGPLADEVKPFFHRNVGQSAWGLAIHSHARIVAVSANTHNITVFKFGLVRCTDVEDGASERASSPDSSARHMDVTFSVINGSSNIPHIAFCNTGHDPHGQWLLTTDIRGNCRSVNLQLMHTHQTFRFGPVTSYLDTHDRLNSGWSIFFLDPRSFVREDSVHAALGLEKGECLPGVQNNPAVWDIGDTVTSIPHRASKFTKNRRRTSERRPTDSASPDSTSHSSRHTASSPVRSEGDATTAAEEDDGTVMDDDENEGRGREPDSDSEGSGESAYMAELEFEDEGTDDSTSFNSVYGGRRIYGNTPRAAHPQRCICEGLPCPILHASVRSVYLLQPSSMHSADETFTAPPTVGFTNALRQLVQGEHAWINAFERLNMHCYIPAIGIVVLASQKGRAMVLSLTRLSQHVQYPAEMKDGRVDKKSNYAMRLERILPFDRQEQQLHRPFTPLHGIAASPIQQGITPLPENQRRWRLMLMYADHSVLSYEISRQRSRDSAVDVGSVVV